MNEGCLALTASQLLQWQASSITGVLLEHLDTHQSNQLSLPQGFLMSISVDIIGITYRPEIRNNIC